MINTTYKTLQIYTTNGCNLNCRYCYEKDSSHMETISHPQDYSIYIDKILELHPDNSKTIETIELWGGEPLLGLQEFVDSLPQFINTFINLKKIKLSSNFTIYNSMDLILLLGFSIYNLDKDITIDLQISLDGPIEINDFNRGNGNTIKVIDNLQNLLDTYPSHYPHLKITTNSILNYDNLYQLNSYEDVANWFDFYITNFDIENNNIDLKFGLFKPVKENHYFTETDGPQFANIMKWADEYKSSHPEESKMFAWPIYRINSLKLCAAGQPHAILALSPSGEQCFCHRGIWEGKYLKDKEDINAGVNLSDIYKIMWDHYNKLAKEYISRKDFEDSLSIYLNLNYCPYDKVYDDVQDLSFMNLFLYYKGAIDILLKWSREAYELDRVNT